MSLRGPPRGSLARVATRNVTAITLSLLATRGPEVNKGVCNWLPEDQGAILELLELKQMLDKWFPKIQGLEAVITTAQGNQNQKYLLQTGQLIKETEDDIRITRWHL